MLSLGLCCTFRGRPIKFKRMTATGAACLGREAAIAKISRLCQANADALAEAITYCGDHGIGCFRINSQILPLKTHPQQGYAIEELPEAESILKRFRECRELAHRRSVRLTFHPDQFVVLNSPRPEVVEASLRELEYQAEVADWVGADVVNIHAGGVYHDKPKALETFARNLGRLSDLARSRLTVENDDESYSPSDLLPLCRAEGIPLVYDVHHHRCWPDKLTEAEATDLAVATWNREPLMHISSPWDGWDRIEPYRHADYIDPDDFPACWLGRDLTVEVEAKAKEDAVLRLMRHLQGMPVAADDRN